MSWRERIKRAFSDPQALMLLTVLAAGALIIYFVGGILAPVIASVIIAYLLEGMVAFLERHSIPRLASVIAVFLAFISGAVVLHMSILPVLLGQMTEFGQQIPDMVSRLQEGLKSLSENYPALIPSGRADQLLEGLRPNALDLGKWTLNSLVSLVVYLFLVPFMVFFLLKDKRVILQAVGRLFSRDSALAFRVWRDVDNQIGNYVRGKFWEILLVWGVSGVTFAILGLRFPVLMGLLVGLSVLIPYLGVAAMTIPVALVAYLQWGFGSSMLWVLIAYGIIQLLDGNVLAPLLLSEVVQLHPVLIIMSILLFGGLWGFWGVFFAVPLATLVRAVVRAWPRTEDFQPSDPGLDQDDARIPSEKAQDSPSSADTASAA